MNQKSGRTGEKLYVVTRMSILIHIVSIIMCMIFVLTFLEYFGKHSRQLAHSPYMRQLNHPQQCLTLWDDAGIRGRILLHFDRHINANLKISGLTPENYIYHGIKKGYIRKIYHIIPDESWLEVSKNIQYIKNAYYVDGTFRLNIDGTPIIALRLKDLPNLKEKVVVNVNARYWSENKISEVVHFLENKGIASDVISVTGTLSDNDLVTMRKYSEKSS